MARRSKKAKAKKSKQTAKELEDDEFDWLQEPCVPKKKKAKAKGIKDILEFALVQDFIKNVGGEYAIDLMRTFQKKKDDLSDEEIAKALGAKVTEIRAVLNRLHYRGIVCYNKARNSKTGWYSFTWSVKESRIAELVMEQRAEEIQKMEKRKEFERNYTFFSCNSNCQSFPFEIAAEYQFKCPECGQTMNAVNNQKIVRDMNAKIKAMKEELDQIQKAV